MGAERYEWQWLLCWSSTKLVLLVTALGLTARDASIQRSGTLCLVCFQFLRPNDFYFSCYLCHKNINQGDSCVLSPPTATAALLTSLYLGAVKMIIVAIISFSYKDI